tara:strand:- start:7267 stop:9294 length:2028 start_codon:yes stop_codon:yes gene_type:complete
MIEKFNNINYNTKFLFLLFIKIIFLFLFSSEYSLVLFQPFLDYFISGIFNPWQYYYDRNISLDAFPYHAFMLYIHSIPAFLGSLFENQPFIANFFFKTPLIIADLLIYKVLLFSFPNKKNKILLFYFLNPIVLYGTYIHSQLDIIPMALLIYSLFYLSKNKITLSALYLGLAMSTKLHVLGTLPFLFLFSLKKYSFSESLKFLYVPIITLIIIDLPYIMSSGFIEMVLLNPKQAMLFDFFFKVRSLSILFPILAILLIYFHFFDQRKINQILLNFYIGLLFSVTIFLIYPAPGWFIWLVPFTSMYFIDNNNYYKSILLHSAFSFFYLLFFIFFYKDEYTNIVFLNNYINFNIDNIQLINFSYTLLEAMLLIVMYSFYKYGIANNTIYKKQTNLTIGVSGDSGSGKTTFINSIALLLNDNLIILEGDAGHKWERQSKNWENYTHLDPKANNMHDLAKGVYDLKHNQNILRSEYNHTTGKFISPKKVFPADFIAISGLHTFYLPNLRKIMDLKIYIDTEYKLRKHWKILRDISKRGYTKKKIIEQLDSRKEDYKMHIYPQINFADLIIHFFSINKFDCGKDTEKVSLGLKLTLNANVNIEHIISNIEEISTWNYNEDLNTQFIIIKEEPNLDFKLFAFKYILNLNEIIDPKAQFLKGYKGFIQFVVLLMISEKLKES